jgi:hypothetical protein
MAKWRIDPKVLQEFLACVLNAYKDGRMSEASAVGTIDHLIGGFDLPPDVTSDPLNYMRNVMAGGTASPEALRAKNDLPP